MISGAADSISDYYEIFDSVDMGNCKMVQHKLVTSNADKISCVEEELCDSIQVDVSEVGLLSFYFKEVLGGPNNFL